MPLTSTLLNYYSLLFIPPCHAVVGQLTESERATDTCQSYCKDMGIPYFRFNVSLDKKVGTVIKHADGAVELLLKARQHLQDSPQLRELVLQLHDLAANGQQLRDICRAPAGALQISYNSN